MSDETLNPADTVAALGLTVESQFVPFSQSRNKDEKHRSLNWRVTLKRDGRDVLTTDYSAGEGHCPSYKQGARQTLHYRALIDHEIETGKAARRHHEMGPIMAGKPILPDMLDVIHSLVMDSEVLDAGGFEEWAADFGYDTDSRKAESIYRACLEIALKLRAALGDDDLSQLREAFQDY